MPIAKVSEKTDGTQIEHYVCLCFPNSSNIKKFLFPSFFLLGIKNGGEIPAGKQQRGQSACEQSPISSGFAGSSQKSTVQLNTFF